MSHWRPAMSFKFLIETESDQISDYIVWTRPMTLGKDNGAVLKLCLIFYRDAPAADTLAYSLLTSTDFLTRQYFGM
jgi:hypothetical protein